MDDKFDFFMEKLLQYAFDNNIGYTLVKKLDPYTPSFVAADQRRMFINMSWPSQLPTRLAILLTGMLVSFTIRRVLLSQNLNAEPI